MGTLLESGLSEGDERRRFHIDDGVFLEQYNEILAKVFAVAAERFGQDAEEWGMLWATEDCRKRVMREVITDYLEGDDDFDPESVLHSLLQRESECAPTVH